MCTHRSRVWTHFLLATLVLAGCRGERGTELLERSTYDGQWRFDKTLIRSYNVTRDQATDAVFKLADDQYWLVRQAISGEYTAEINVRTQELIVIDFSVWSPPGKATSIGVKYAEGNKIGSIRTFDLLEKLLPNKRIGAN